MHLAITNHTYSKWKVNCKYINWYEFKTYVKDCKKKYRLQTHHRTAVK